MTPCKNCDHKFSHMKMVLTMKYLNCPSCGTKYKIAIKNMPTAIISVVAAYFLLTYIDSVLPNNIYMAYLAVILLLILLSPFNLCLKIINEQGTQ